MNPMDQPEHRHQERRQVERREFLGTVVLAEGGGIETMGLYYGGVGAFTPQVEQVVLDKAAAL